MPPRKPAIKSVVTKSNSTARTDTKKSTKGKSVTIKATKEIPVDFIEKLPGTIAALGDIDKIKFKKLAAGLICRRKNEKKQIFIFYRFDDVNEYLIALLKKINIADCFSITRTKIDSNELEIKLTSIKGENLFPLIKNIINIICVRATMIRSLNPENAIEKGLMEDANLFFSKNKEIATVKKSSAIRIMRSLIAYDDGYRTDVDKAVEDFNNFMAVFKNSNVRAAVDSSKGMPIFTVEHLERSIAFLNYVVNFEPLGNVDASCLASASASDEKVGSKRKRKSEVPVAVPNASASGLSDATPPVGKRTQTKNFKSPSSTVDVKAAETMVLVFRGMSGSTATEDTAINEAKQKAAREKAEKEINDAKKQGTEYGKKCWLNNNSVPSVPSEKLKRKYKQNLIALAEYMRAAETEYKRMEAQKIKDEPVFEIVDSAEEEVNAGEVSVVKSNTYSQASLVPKFSGVLSTTPTASNLTVKTSNQNMKTLVP